MKSSVIVQFATWLFWNVTYWFRPRPNELSEVLLKGRRTWWPWKKFRPSAWHNDAGQQWEVYFTDERACTELRTIELEVHVGNESGDIVGFDVYDQTLRCKDTDG